MTNNEKLVVIQKRFKLKSDTIMSICFCNSEYTIYAWRSKPNTARHRNMPDSKYQLLVNWILLNHYADDEPHLDQIIQALA